LKLRLRIPAALLAVAALVALSPGTAQALTATYLDQQQLGATRSLAWGSNAHLSQTFKAGYTGTITRVDLYANTYGTSVEFAVVGGSFLDDQKVTWTTAGWHVITLATPAHLTKGASYSLRLTSSSTLDWYGNCTDAYANGQATVIDLDYKAVEYTIPAYAGARGYSTTTYCTRDFAFKTYMSVTLPTLPPPVFSVGATATPIKAATPKPTAKPAATSGSSAIALASPTDSAAPNDTPAATGSAAPSDTPDRSSLVAGASESGAATDAASPSAAPAAPTGSGGGDAGGPILVLFAAIVVVAAGARIWWLLVGVKRGSSHKPNAG
jgi:hypothetical protein